jgi:mannose-6-phosphate isomerase-like protein (cupin superfamily)
VSVDPGELEERSAVLVENDQVKKINYQGLLTQGLAGPEQGLKTMEIRLLTLPPGVESPVTEHFSEVVGVILRGTGRAILGKRHQEDLFPNTTLIIPPHVTHQVINTGTEDLVIVVARGLVPLPED